MSKTVCPYVLSALYSITDSETYYSIDHINHAREHLDEICKEMEIRGLLDNVDYYEVARAIVCMGKQCAKYNQCAGKKS